MPSSLEVQLDGAKCEPRTPEQAPEPSLWERLGNAAMLDIESSSFSWDALSSLYHTEHNSSTDQSEDDVNKALEVTVNSGGVVFYALFKQPDINGNPKEAAAVIKFATSRMAAQSERLGYEFAKLLGVGTPQVRVIHNSSSEWLQIKEAAEKARVAASAERDEVGGAACAELLEALELSRCLLLMSYVHGSPLLESSSAFKLHEPAEKTAEALGRILVLDLVIRNEDRFPCPQLRWRGNPSNLLLTDRTFSANVNALEDDFDSTTKQSQPKVLKVFQKERRAASVDSRLDTQDSSIPDLSEVLKSPTSSETTLRSQTSCGSVSSYLSNCHIVAIDLGVPRRPPAKMRVNDQENYPKLVELLLNSFDYASNLLFDITGGMLGKPSPEDAESSENQVKEMVSVVQGFRAGFRAAIRDLQGFHIFLLTLHQKLDSLLRSFLNIVSKTIPGAFDKEELMAPDSSSPCALPCKDRFFNENQLEFSDLELQKTGMRTSSSGYRDGSESSSPSFNCQVKYSKAIGDSMRSLRFATKLRDIQKFAKVDYESSKELEQWNDIVRNDAVKLCQENNFKTGFFEGGDNNSVVDAYELKVRLEHILERISLISDAANTEKPSPITGSLFIGGALAARSVYTLQHLGITHVLCLCSNEIGQSDSQHPDLFVYKNYSIYDSEDVDIGSIFEEASDFIDHVESIGQRVLVHCFEGRSRSATLVIAYLMLRKNFTLQEAWNAIRRVHRRAQPNDGFAKILLDLDKKLHGKVSMEWQQRKPLMRTCPICGKNAGLSSSSLKLHLQKSHRKLSSGSVDSAMTMEIQKVLETLKMTRSGNGSPTQRTPHTSMEV